MIIRISLLVSFYFISTGLCDARPLPVLSYGDQPAKADVVLMVRPFKTRDWMERDRKATKDWLQASRLANANFDLQLKFAEVVWDQ